MKLNSVSQLNFLEKHRKEMSIIGLEMKSGRIYDSLAQRNAGFKSFHLKLFRDQILASIRQLEYFYQLDPKNDTLFSMKKLALESLYRTYSFGLRENSLMSRDEDGRLIHLLLTTILEPFGDTHGYVKYDKTAVAKPNSRLWVLSDYSLDLIRFLFDNHWKKLDGSLGWSFEIRFMNLLDITQKAHLEGLSFPGTSKRVANAIYILHKIFDQGMTLGPSDQIRPSHICDKLFPLACEFAAKEYPMTIVDPIGYYMLFESSGTLKEPDDILTQWERRHGTASKRDEDLTSTSLDPLVKSRPLPPNHVSLEYSIYKLIISNPESEQLELIKFLQRKILEQDDTSNVIKNGALDDSENSRLPLMNKIVALSILGRINYHNRPKEMSSFVKVLILPNLKNDSLLMKICKIPTNPLA